MLAVACYIIYADLDLMEHMCIWNRHSSQISWKPAHTRLYQWEECKAETGLWGNTITHLWFKILSMYACTHTHTLSCLYTHSLLIYHVSSTLYSKHSTIGAHWHQKINNTKHYTHSKQSISLYTLKMAISYALLKTCQLCCINIISVGFIDVVV